MRIQLVIILLVSVFLTTAEAQQKKRGKVKRKYRDVEAVNKRLPDVYFSGEVHDADGKPIPGASVRIKGFRNGVHTNEDGRFILKKLATGQNRIEVACLGFETKTSDFFLQSDYNFHNVSLDLEKFHVGTVVDNIQKRLQHIPDIPLSMSAITCTNMFRDNRFELENWSAYTPGFSARETFSNQTGYTLRGINAEPVEPGAFSQMGVMFNNVPIDQIHGNSREMFDMENVVVARGPQNVLSGTEGLAGSLRFTTQMAEKNKSGYISASAGNFGRKDFRGAFNFPVIKNRLYVRVAGMYNRVDSIRKNPLSGNMDNAEKYGGRFSALFLPAYNQRGDLVLNYQKDKVKTLTDAILNYRLYLNENNYFAATSSYNTASSTAVWDGDGTLADAALFNTAGNSSQFFEELRFNFSRRSRLNGSIGYNFRHLTTEKSTIFKTNEQDLAPFLFTENPVDSLGNVTKMNTVPPGFENRVQAGLPLISSHTVSSALNGKLFSHEIFLDLEYQLINRFYVTLGARGYYVKNQLESDSTVVDGNEATLGQWTGNSPNILFLPHDSLSSESKQWTYTWRTGLRYRYSDALNLYAIFSRGIKPKSVVPFGDSLYVTDQEKLINYELGMKMVLFTKLYFDLSGYFYDRTGFNNPAFFDGKTDITTPQFTGKSISFGIETSVNATIMKGLSFWGHYNWQHSRLYKNDMNGTAQYRGGMAMLFSPDHNFSAGLEASVTLKKTIRFFVSPQYSYKSSFLVNYRGENGLRHSAYGLVNLNAGANLIKEKMTLSFWGNNMLNQKYSADYYTTGNPLNLSVEIPGFPRSFGGRLTWEF